MNPFGSWESYCPLTVSHTVLKKHFCQYQILEKKSFSPHIISETKGLEEQWRKNCNAMYLGL